MMILGMPWMLEIETLEECAALCQSLGLHFVELNANFPVCQVERLHQREIQRLSEQYGISFTMHVEEDFDPFSFNSYVRASWIKTFEMTMKLAQETNMPMLTMHLPKGIYITQPEKKVFLYEQYSDEYQYAVTRFRDFCTDTLRGSDVRIGIENTSGFMEHEKQAVRCLLESSVFGLTLDTGHAHTAGGVDYAFFKQYENRLIHMHAHDAQGRRDHLALGDGEADLRQSFHWAAKNQAQVVLEVKTIAALTESVRRLPDFDQCE